MKMVRGASALMRRQRIRTGSMFQILQEKAMTGAFSK